MRKLTFLRQHRAITSQQPVEISGAPESLEQRLAGGPLPLLQALQYAIGLADALRETHARGRVYGSLHPGGIAIVEGQVRLLPSTPVSLSAYFSPEQVAGHDVDGRSDIFSLGAVMYEMLTGRRAFRASLKPALRIEILNSEPAPLEGIPAGVANLVRRCLEKRPERRLQRVEILLAHLKLQIILGGRADKAAPEGERAATMSRWMPPPAVAPPLREKVDSVCPMCGTFDVYKSEPLGFLETRLVQLGVRLNRCYSCYERFLQFAGMVSRRPGQPVVWIYPDAARSPRDTSLE